MCNRWQVGGGHDDVSQWEPLGISAHLLVTSAGDTLLLTL